MNLVSKIGQPGEKRISVAWDSGLIELVQVLGARRKDLDLYEFTNQPEAPQLFDFILCDARSGSPGTQDMGATLGDATLVAVVENLSGVDSNAFLTAGMSEIISVDDLHNGRFDLLLQSMPLANVHAESANSEGLGNPAHSHSNNLAIRNNFMSVLSDVSLKLMERMSLEDLMDHIAEQAVNLANSDAAFVSTLHESSEYLQIVGAHGRFSDMKGFHHELNEDVAGLAWSVEDLVLIENAADEAKLQSLWGDATKRCAVPFFSNGEFAGVVCVSLDSTSSDLETCLDILKLFTRTVSIAIENAVLYSKQQEELDRHIAISEITHSFYSASNFNELMDGVCESVLNVFDSKHVVISRRNKDGKLSVAAEWISADGEARRVSYLNGKIVSESISQWAAETRQKVLLKRGVNDERESASVQKIKRLLDIGCNVSLPLQRDDEVWGVMTISKSAEQRDYTDVELSLLDLIVSQLSSSVLRQNLLDEIHFQAFHDSLTELPNRLKFENTISEVVSEGTEKIALLFLDLDGFKAVNDNQGHTVGDELLKRVSKRLTGCLHEKDLLARMGGDEFAVLLRGVKSKENALSIAKRLSGAIAQNFIVDNYNIKIGVSIGVSFFPDNGETVDDLLRNADFAMYEAKAEGSGTVRTFTQDMAAQYQRRVAFENELNTAIESGQFELHYQPKIDLTIHQVTGVEALLRWNHPEHGSMTPDQFVSLAEEAGYITQLGKWVLDEAAGQLVQWQKSGISSLTMAVNISSPQFVQDDFAVSVLNTLAEHEIDPARFELEVTESVVMNSLSKVVNTLTELRDGGVSIAIDDFGTGYSSLAYLENLPLDCLKIDKVFIDKLNSGEYINSLVNTILTMARSFGLRTIAEGVEDEEQIRKLVSLGCECVQGYYFSPPLTASELPNKVAEINQRFGNVRKAG